MLNIQMDAPTKKETAEYEIPIVDFHIEKKQELNIEELFSKSTNNNTNVIINESLLKTQDIDSSQIYVFKINNEHIFLSSGEISFDKIKKDFRKIYGISSYDYNYYEKRIEIYIDYVYDGQIIVNNDLIKNIFKRGEINNISTKKTYRKVCYI
jgi:hypothetical protein